MDKLFKWGMILFFITGLILGNEKQMMEGIINTPKEVYNLVLMIMLSMCLWGGFLNVIEKSGFMNLFSKFLKPLLKIIYGSIVDDYNIYNHLSLNVIANLLGMGTLATVSGLKAFISMYNYKKYVCREMITLVVVNCSGLSLFPSSLIMIRKEMGSINLYEFYPYMLFISIFVLISGLIIIRLCYHE